MLEKPQYTSSFDDIPGEAHKPTDVGELTKKVLRSLSPSPVIAELPDTFVKLPAGIIRNKEVFTDAQVQELTGQHEEELARAQSSNNPAKVISILLQSGTVSVGEEKASPALLESMLQGDLNMLILGIRKATFGNAFEVFNVQCPHCGNSNDISMDLSDVPVRELEDPEIREFTVDLRKNRKAKVTFPTGKVQTEIFKQKNQPLTLAEANSITLAMCVKSFTEADGSTRMCNGLSDVKNMSIPDRHTVYSFINDNEPGPRYDEVVALCPSCEGEVPVPLTVAVLFREI